MEFSANPIYIVAMEYSSPARLLSDTQLLGYSKEHLRYEIWMFFSSGIEFSRTRFSTSDVSSLILLKNVYLESFVSHLRILLMFLYPYGTEQDDVIADYFFINPIPEWKQKRPTETAELQKARQRASREISHLTILRRDGTNESKSWPISKLMQTINAILKIFVENASPLKLDS